MDEKIWMNIRITREGKEQLRKDAHHHEKNVTEYLLWLIEEERKRVNNAN